MGEDLILVRLDKHVGLKSKYFAVFPFSLLFIFATACVPSPADTPPTLAVLSATPYASLTPIPTPSSTSTPVPPTTTATEIPDVRAIRSVIHAYFDMRYSAFVAMVPLQPEDFSDVVLAQPDAVAFLNAELEKLAIQMKWYELTNLGLVSYEFFFTDEEIVIENSGLAARVVLSENAHYSRQRSPSTITSRFNVRHEILLRKENGVWKIISDQYTDEFWETIRNSGRSPKEILRDLALPTPDDTRLHARIHQLVEQNTPLECKIKNSEGRFFVSGDELFYSYLVVNSTTLDEKLEKNFPNWENFSQSLTFSNAPVPLSVIIVDASIQKEYQLNPAITLVTLGESLDWELPDDGDVATRAKNISKQLHDSFADWYLSKSGEYQNEYPQIESAATYALYQFFQGDEEKLESWCVSIQNLFLETGK